MLHSGVETVGCDLNWRPHLRWWLVWQEKIRVTQSGRPPRKAQLDIPEGVEVFLYSGQRLQYSELQKEEMRRRLAEVGVCLFL